MPYLVDDLKNSEGVEQVVPEVAQSSIREAQV